MRTVTPAAASPSRMYHVSRLHPFLSCLMYTPVVPLGNVLYRPVAGQRWAAPHSLGVQQAEPPRSVKVRSVVFER